ncbi:MAG: acyl-CoA carboxylase subunit beta [Lachnospiraceae bacterium]|nr:acyl-CoA carboxylase subunit beta [Lachnospiraceae bacterium]
MNVKQEDFLKRKEELMKMGGDARIEKQHASGKLTCRERLSLLFDPGTFEEIGLFVEHRKMDFGMDKRKVAGDGLVCGYGKVDGRVVFAYAQDFTSMGGSIGEMTGQKMLRVQRGALRAGVPIVALEDGSGGRLQEGVVMELTELFNEHVKASGVIPQVTAIMGPCAGGCAYSPALTDFCICVDKTSKMFLTGPKVIKAVTHEEPDANFGSGKFHNTVSGVGHALAKDDYDCIRLIREYLSYFPQNSKDKPPVYQCDQDPDALVPELNDIVPESMNKSYDAHSVLELIFDKDSLFEYQPLWAKNVITSFARLNGKSVGIIANNPKFMGGVFDIDASDKAARFIMLCDAFNIPLIYVADTPGFLPGINQEKGGVIRHGAKVLYANGKATVPKIRLTTRKLYGGATAAMCERTFETDCTISWPNAEENVMGAEGAVEVLFARELKAAKAEGDEEKYQKILKEEAAEYNRLFANPYDKAKYFHTEMIIMPEETRRVLIRMLEFYENKKVLEWDKKHGIFPV